MVNWGTVYIVIKGDIGAQSTIRIVSTSKTRVKNMSKMVQSFAIQCGSFCTTDGNTFTKAKSTEKLDYVPCVLKCPL